MQATHSRAIKTGTTTQIVNQMSSFEEIIDKLSEPGLKQIDRQKCLTQLSSALKKGIFEPEVRKRTSLI